MNRTPQVIRQEILAGNAVAGVVPAGPAMVDSGETLIRGLYRTYTDCTAGGLFIPPGVDLVGWRLERVLWSLPGAGGVTLNIIDEDANVYEVFSAAGVSGVWVAIESGGLMVLPGWSVQFLTANPVGPGNGNMVVHVGQGLNQDVFTSGKILGEEFYPPSRQP